MSEKAAGSGPEKSGMTGAAGITRNSGKVWWSWLKRTLALLFFAGVAWLVFEQAQGIDWREVGSTLRGYPRASLLGAAALAATSLLLYSCFDLLGRHYTGHRLRAPRVMLVTFTSYVLNLNLGSLVGGVALRYRLYSRLGLRLGVITRVITISMLTNWMGYLMLGGFVFSFFTPGLPPTWKISSSGLQILGFALLGAGTAYLALCAFSPRRRFMLRGHALALPSGRLALLQVCLGALNWMIMGGVVFVLLQQTIAYPAVLSVLLVAAVAGVITHVPAGLGVLEAVFVALLSHQLPQHELLAALVAYRVIYYLAPLLLAALALLLMEMQAKAKAEPAKA